MLADQPAHALADAPTGESLAVGQVQSQKPSARFPWLSTRRRDRCPELVGVTGGKAATVDGDLVVDDF